MIVDNADDPDVFFAPLHEAQVADTARPRQEAELLANFLPQSPNGSILLTSRNQDVAFRLTGSHTFVFKVNPMSENDALALLKKKLGLGAGTTPERSMDLLQALDCMPLAVSQAAAYIARRAPHMTVSQYLDEMRTSEQSRTRLLEHDAGDLRRDGRASNSILATWQISFEHIRQTMPTAARLLSLMSLFDRQGIPRSLLENQYELEKTKKKKSSIRSILRRSPKQQRVHSANFEDDIHALLNYALVGIDPSGYHFEMHRLVQYSTKKWLDLSGELDTWKGVYVELLDKSYPYPCYMNWQVCQSLFPHAQAAIECLPSCAKTQEAWASVLFNAAWFSYEMGRYDVAQDMGARTLAVRETLLGKEHHSSLESIDILGSTLWAQGKYDAAETMHRRALEGREKLLGKEHPHTLISVNSLALVLHNQGKYDAAETMLRRVLEGREKLLGKEHPHTLNSVHNLASVQQAQGRYESAQIMYYRVLEGSEKLLGKEHPDTLASVYGLAYGLHQQHQYNDALVLYKRAKIGYTRVLGPEHPDTIACSQWYACLVQDMRDQGLLFSREDISTSGTYKI